VSSYDQQTEDQTTLQDAAVKSATSLIAVVNDMLRSPLASARLPPPSSTLAPSFGRPRSRTAPSTPLVEAPSYPLVELPGSIPERPRGSHHHSYDSKIRHSMRPNSHFKRPSHPWLHLPVDPKTNSTNGDSQDVTLSGTNLTSTPKQQQVEGPTISTCKSSKSVAHPRRIWSDPIQSHGTLRPASAFSRHDTAADRHNSQLSSTPRQTGGESRLFCDQSHQSSGEAFHVAHASSLQASHEAHVAALTQAHQRELASLHLYIEQLEPRYGLARRSEVHAHPSVRHYSGVQSDSPNKHTDPWRSVVPRHHQNLRQSNPMDHTHGIADLHCTSLAGCGELWLECNHLRNTLEHTTTRLTQSEETIHRLRSAEKVWKTTIEDLRSRLSAANDQRLDAQEGFHDACCRVRGLAEREASLALELEELHKCSSISTATVQDHNNGHDDFKMQNARRRPAHETSSTSSASHSPPPSLSPSQTPSPSDLGISIPQTPRTIASATMEALLVTTETPGAYKNPRTPPASVHKELPLPPPDSSPLPLRVRRGETMKSVGESIIELYARRDGDGWDRGWSAEGMDEVGEKGWVEWV